MSDEVFYKGEDEANCRDCVAEWVLAMHFINREPKPHLTRFLAVVSDAYLCEKHYRRYLSTKAIQESKAR